jgi:hypothetical protein
MPLRITAKVPHGGRGYFKELLEPQIDGHQSRWTGEVTDKTKEHFLAGAAALLFPIDWPEPFGPAIQAPGMAAQSHLSDVPKPNWGGRPRNRCRY